MFTRKLYLYTILIIILQDGIRNNVSGQNNYFGTFTLQMENNFSFPVFSKDSDSLSAKKINQYLQLTELELIHGYEKKNPFERVAIDLINPIPGKEMIKYQITRNDSLLLSFNLTQSHCGYGCKYWVSYYNFNPRTGELIYLKDLIEEKAYPEFLKIVQDKRLDRYYEDNKIRDTTYCDNFDAFRDRTRADRLQDYSVKNDTLYLDYSNCFGKGKMFETLNPLTGIPIPFLKKYLNNYGMSVFGFAGTNQRYFRSHQLPQLFSGNNGPDSILMIFNIQDRENVNGVLFNFTNGHTSQLRGSLQNNQLLFFEFDAANKEAGYLEIGFEGQNLRGVHFNKDKTEKRNFFVHP